ncbi:exopolyphosphatase/guanosine-5'-triphosphate,3'-diphosphate pyrophosphatase [Neisseria sp. HSC-16F19]|nr:Ppx/GppA phosphatase family protein [Neisseria sp. HSC-16F19]MCP2039631.1 exopolyphosphatase/guanosine-5'-triphosphate,3'-diphosphate pyrophosphatase [Neisseria sp. HSC-16F19]
MTTEDMLASVDLGSNSFRLQICHHHNDAIKVVDSIKEMVRLAAGLDEHKMLDAASQQRALACLARFGERLRGFGPGQVRAVATNTFRVAKNIDAFLPLAEQALGFPIDIIAGREEARLIYTGVVHTLPTGGRRMLVVDIGGGSTEFVIGSRLQPDITESLSMGCVSYSLQYLPKNRVGAKEFQAAVTAARAEVQRIRHDLLQHGWDFAVVTSGTARAIRDVIAADGMPGDSINLPAMRRIARDIIDAGSTKKANLTGLKADRVEVFAGGLAVMIGIFEELGLQEAQVTDAALRDGVFYDMMGRRLDDDMRHQTVHAFQERYQADRKQGARVAELADMCFTELTRHDPPANLSQWQQYLRWAAALHEIGLSIAHSAYHKHGAYILDQADMAGFSRQEQHILSMLVLGHRGDLRKMTTEIRGNMLWFGVLAMRLAVLFSRARQAQTLPALQLRYHAKDKEYVLSLPQAWLDDNPLTAGTLREEAQQWQKIGHPLKIKGV